MERLWVFLLAFFIQFWYLCIVYRRLYFRKEQPNQGDLLAPSTKLLITTSASKFHVRDFISNIAVAIFDPDFINSRKAMTILLSMQVRT